MKINIKKVVSTVAMVTVVAASLSYATVKANSGDWKTESVNASYSSMIDVANNTKNELTKDISGDITKTIKVNVNDTIEQQEKELKRLLEEHYQMKLQGVVNTEEYKKVENQIIQIRKDLVDTYKKRIDEEFKK